VDSHFFETIMTTYTKKKVISLCKKLIKKCSFNSGADAENLCHLAYRLFTYGHINEVLNICKATHNASFPGKGAYRVWEFILSIWGLEVYLLKESGKDEEAKQRIEAMDTIWKTNIHSYLTDEKKVTMEIGRRSRFLYQDILLTNKISSSSDTISNEYRFIALFKMIGYGATGLFPDLTNHWTELKLDINSYISILSTIK